MNGILAWGNRGRPRLLQNPIRCATGTASVQLPVPFRMPCLKSRSPLASFLLGRGPRVDFAQVLT